MPLLLSLMVGILVMWWYVQVEMMVDERIEKQLQAHRDIGGSSEMKNEIRLLWAEVEALSKNREEMQGQVDHLISMAQKAQEHASREQDILKNENGFLRNQLQSLKNDGVQVSSLLCLFVSWTTAVVTPMCFLVLVSSEVAFDCESQIPHGCFPHLKFCHGHKKSRVKDTASCIT
jgi:hypothetical protein